MAVTDDPTLEQFSSVFQSDEAQRLMRVAELCGDVQRHTQAGEWAMAQDSVNDLAELISGGNTEISYKVMCVWYQPEVGELTLPTFVTAPTRTIALLEARLQIIAAYKLPDDAHVRTLIDCEVDDG